MDGDTAVRGLILARGYRSEKRAINGLVCLMDMLAGHHRHFLPLGLSHSFDLHCGHMVTVLRRGVHV